MEFLFIDFMNSDWRDWRGSGKSEDRLENSVWINHFLNKWGLDVDLPPDLKTIEKLRELRRNLQGIVRKITMGELPDQSEMNDLGTLISQSLFARKLVLSENGYRLTLIPQNKDWDWVTSEICTSFLDFMIHHDPSRLRICKNTDCQWVFYDESKNKSKRWCHDPCRVLVNVRNFRQRNK